MQNMYYNTNDSTNYTPVAGVINNLITFAQNPANIPNGTGFSGANESAFWATKGEMRISKANDQTYPTTKAVPTNPQTP
jgi:hypothetical protein